MRVIPSSSKLFPGQLIAAGLICGVALWMATAPATGANARFYSDDPIWRDPETQDASKTKALELSGQYDLIENSFLGAGETTDTRALNVNTVDEVPDSSWFTNRIGPRMSGPPNIPDLVKGADTGSGPAPGHVDGDQPQERGRHPRLHHQGQRRRDLLDQVRSQGLPRDGQRR